MAPEQSHTPCFHYRAQAGVSPPNSPDGMPEMRPPQRGVSRSGPPRARPPRCRPFRTRRRAEATAYSFTAGPMRVGPRLISDRRYSILTALASGRLGSVHGCT